MHRVCKKASLCVLLVAVAQFSPPLSAEGQLSYTDLAETRVSEVLLIQEDVLSREEADLFCECSIDLDPETGIPKCDAVLALKSLPEEVKSWVQLKRLMLQQQGGDTQGLLDDGQAWLKANTEHPLEKAVRRFVAYHFAHDERYASEMSATQRLSIIEPLLDPLISEPYLLTPSDVQDYLWYSNILRHIALQSRVAALKEVTSKHEVGLITDEEYYIQVEEVEVASHAMTQRILQLLTASSRKLERFIADLSTQVVDETQIVSKEEAKQMAKFIAMEIQSEKESQTRLERSIEANKANIEPIGGEDGGVAVDCEDRAE